MSEETCAVESQAEVPWVDVPLTEYEDHPLVLLAGAFFGTLKRSLITCGVLLAVGVLAWVRLHSIGTGTVYSAVTLNNGNTYYGKLSGLGSAYPVLDKPFTVQMRLDPLSAKEKFELHPTAEGWHNPDSMIISASQIVYVEPVLSASQVGRLLSKMTVNMVVTGLPKE